MRDKENIKQITEIHMAICSSETLAGPSADYMALYKRWQTSLQVMCLSNGTIFT
jgi:hypothetical protein